MTPAERRKKENDELLERMKDPQDKLTRVDQKATFFPPRPVIEKDEKEIKRIFKK